VTAWSPDPQLDELIDQYVDQRMDPAAQRRFEALIASDPRLRAEVNLRQSADASLRRLFAPPAALPALQSPAANGDRWRLYRRFAAAAAILLLIGTGAFAYIRATDPARQWRRQGPGSAARAYDLVVEKNNFVPAWTCQSDDDFAQYAREHTGEGWHVVGPENLKLVGWTYVPNELTENTTVLLATLDQEKIAVLAGEARFDRGVTLPANTKLHIFRKQVGDVVFYEISPRCKPSVVQYVQPVAP